MNGGCGDGNFLTETGGVRKERVRFYFVGKRKKKGELPRWNKFL